MYVIDFDELVGAESQGTGLTKNGMPFLRVRRVRLDLFRRLLKL